MALIKLGGVVTQISGKIGGQTFGTSASGAYMKNSGTPRKSITLLQRSKMSAMATTAQAWRALTQEQRDVFNAASPDYPYLNRVGETKFYSGYAIFTKLRNNALNVSFSGIPVPLPKVSFSPLVGVEVDEGGMGLQILADSGAEASVSYRLFCTRPSSLGLSSPYKNFFFVAAMSGTQLAGTFNFDLRFTSKFGPYVGDTKFFYRLDAISTSTGQSLKGIASGSYTF